MSSLALTQKERNAMMEQVYGGFQKNPTYTEAAGVDSSDSEYSHGRAGEIDFYAYGGDARDIGDSEDFYMAKHHDRWKNYGQDHPVEGYTYGDRWRNRDTWKKVKDHLGIDRLDSKDELRQMYDFVQGYQMQQAPAEGKDDEYTPITTQPVEEKPQEVQDAVKDYEDSKLENPGNTQPKFSDVIKTDLGGNPTSNPMLDSIKHGDDLNEWYQTKFVPHLEKEAHATAHEIGNSTRYFIDKFVFQPPKLGDPKELFEYYSDKIKSD